MLFPPLNKKNTRDKGMPSPTLAIDKFVEERAVEELRSDLVQQLGREGGEALLKHFVRLKRPRMQEALPHREEMLLSLL